MFRELFQSKPIFGISCFLLCVTATILAEESHFTFKDVGEQSGLLKSVRGIHGHGAAWGDVNQDGFLDLYVGTFHNEGPANLLMINQHGKFSKSENSSTEISTRATGIVFADFDNDGDLDLYVASMPATGTSKLGQRTGHALLGCTLFQNDGTGKFTNISEKNGACPEAFGGRSATVLDFNGDGLLDLLVGEDPNSGYNGSPTASTRLFRNEGKLQFKDVSQEVGLPKDIPGLGVAAGDLNNDGAPDFFIASSGEEGNRLFLNDGKGMFSEAVEARETFAWPKARKDNMVCGVTFGDVNRDGLLDVVIGQHFERPWLEPVANRIYLNRGNLDQANQKKIPKFEDITEQANLTPLSMKSPHVELQDFDNDGWPDLYFSVVKFDEQHRPHPFIFRHQGLKNGIPKFQCDALDVNDFPTAEDKTIKRTGTFFEKMILDRKIIYTAPGPCGDFNNDGKLDLFLGSWWTQATSLLLQNDSKTGNWLTISLDLDGNVNRMGIGSRINLYPAGEVGNQKALLGSREIAVGFGYASGQPAVAHFGLAELETVDLEIVLPFQQGTILKKNVSANQQLLVKNEVAQRVSEKQAVTKKQAVKKVAAKKQTAKKKPAPKQSSAKVEVTYPPKLPENQTSITDTSAAFLKPTETLREGIEIAKTAPTVDFLFYPGQDYPGNPWSNWGDGLAVDGKYYSAIGDHWVVNKKDAPGRGAAFVFEYDPEKKRLRELLNTAKVIDLPKGHYLPGKIHSRVDMGSDGWLYCATHRGSKSATIDDYHYQGDWILRCHPQTGKSEIVVHAPVAKHAIPNTVLDPERMIFYGGTAAGINSDKQDIRFFAYDVKNKKLLYEGGDGPARYMILARSTGKLYYVPGNGEGAMMSYDPATNKPPVEVKGSNIGIRAATQETKDGMVYTISTGQKSGDANVWSFNTKTEEIKQIGTAAVGKEAYVAAVSVDPTGKYLYYIPGAHGGGYRDGSPIVQFNVKTGTKKVIAFLDPYYTNKYGFTLKGTYSTSIDPQGDKLYTVWNVSRGTRAWDCCGLTVVHIPKSERE